MPVEVEVPAWLFSCSFADGKIAGNMVKYSRITFGTKENKLWK